MFPDAAGRVANACRAGAQALDRSPSLAAIAVAGLVAVKTAVQILILGRGYVAYGADDFTRRLSADYWLLHPSTLVPGDGWLGFAGSVWLPLPDYLFGLGLAIHRDLFFTPPIENLLISSGIVVAAYVLGRTLFGRAAGVFTAALAALQPWHVWLGASGMSSDPPSILLIMIFAAYLFRWFKTDRPRTLMAAAVSLGLAHGFRHESWCFAAVTSIVLVIIAFSRWRKNRLTARWASGVAAALVLMNAFPVLWMAKSFLIQGEWMPHFSWSQWNPPASAAAEAPGPEMASSDISYMGIPLLAGGSFPFEIALFLIGAVVVLRSRVRGPHRLFLTILAAAFLVFAIGFKGQIAASIVFARYLVPFVMVALPYAGGLLRSLLDAGHARRQAALAACVITLAVIGFDVLRAFNYPSQFPADAISAGWTLRNLQDTGAVSPSAKVLIERAEDWGDLGIVVLTNRPERFVVLNELAYRQTALWRKSANRPAPISARLEDGVRGTVCGEDFQLEACRTSVAGEHFELVILSSPRRALSFEKAFGAPARIVGRYHIFDLRAAGDRSPLPRR
jgi:Dolichyl-phosphate-mannose-protein mannosyltransferase